MPVLAAFLVFHAISSHPTTTYEVIFNVQEPTLNEDPIRSFIKW